MDASAVARGTAISTNFKDLRGGNVQFLPQKIVVLAQGATASTYAATKRPTPSELDTANTYGFGSYVDLMVGQLFPLNGDGVGTIPVTVIPLLDAAASVAAAGTITPSGTATASGTRRVRVAGIESLDIVIPSGASNATRDCAAIGDAISAVLRMPVNVGYTYGTVTSTPGTNTGTGTNTALTVTGTPRPGSWTLKCTAAVANGGTFSLTDPKGTIVSTTLVMTPGVGLATVFNVAGLQFTITDGATDFAVNDSFTITVPATAVTLTAKWKGLTGNDILLEVINDPGNGTVLTVTGMTGGLVNPSAATVTTALAQIGANDWQTIVLHPYAGDSSILDAISTWGEGRWNELVRKPAVAFSATTSTDEVNTAAGADLRRTDRTNVLLTAPGSPNLPGVIAARQVARIAVVANNNPPMDYGNQQVTGIVPGLDSVQWAYNTRDDAVKHGVSTTEVKDGVVTIGDVVTYYHPTGDNLPAYRYVCDIVKVQNVIYNVDSIFADPSWAAAPMIPDDQPTVNVAAKKPSMAKAAINGMIDNLGLQAILSDPKTAKAQTTAAIDPANPKRLNVSATVQIAGNTDVKAITLNWAFYFGKTA